MQDVQLLTKSDTFNHLVRERRSVRSFLSTPVPEEVIRHCLELAALAPNSCNLQPWEFMVIRNPVLLEKMQPVCLNQKAARAPLIIAVLAKPNAWRTSCPDIIKYWPEATVPRAIQSFYSRTAPFQYDQGRFGIKGLAKKILTFFIGLKNPVMRSPSSHADMRLWAVKSCSLAAENLMLAFQSNDYATCPMEGFDEKRLKDLLNYDAKSIPIMLISVGKPGERAVFNPRLRFSTDNCVTWL